MSQFDKITEGARKVLTLAKEEALRFNHNYIGTEHLLLGLVQEGNGVATRVLTNLGVQLPDVRSGVESFIKPAEATPVGEIELTPQAKRVIEFAVDEARLLNHRYIGAEHILLGLVRKNEGIAGELLGHLGVNLEKVRAEVRLIVNHQPTAESKPEIPLISDNETQSRLRVKDWRDSGESVTSPPDCFSEAAKSVLRHAHDEAQRFNHNYIGTEHILLGLTKEGDGVAARVLTQLRVGLPKIRSAVEYIIGRGVGEVDAEIGLTPRSRKVIELAFDEARRLNHDLIDTEHLLLGLVREGEGIASGVLESLGVNLEKVRANVLQVVPSTTVPGEAKQKPEASTSRSASRIMRELLRSSPLPKDDITPSSDSTATRGGMFHRFTPRAKETLTIALDEAHALHYNSIGTGHLLLALLRDRDTIAARVINNISGETQRLRTAVRMIIQPREGEMIGEFGLTPRAKRVIELSIDEMRRNGQTYIGTEHLLVGLIRADAGIAAGVLLAAGISLERTREEIRRIVEARPPIEVPEHSSDLPSEATSDGEDWYKPDRSRPEYMIPNEESRAQLQVNDWTWANGTLTSDVHEFTAGFRTAVSFADEEARRLHHNYVGTEHLLLGLVREKDGIAANVLKSFGLGLPKARAAVEFIIGRGVDVPGSEIGLTARTRLVVALAVYEYQDLGYKECGTEHLLLGLIREGEGIGAGVLASIGVSLHTIRPKVLEVLESRRETH